jgi:hypothetical protein
MKYFPKLKAIQASGDVITLKFMMEVILLIAPAYSFSEIRENWDAWNPDQEYGEYLPLNRRTMSVLTDQIFEPFEMPIHMEGDQIK